MPRLVAFVFLSFIPKTSLANFVLTKDTFYFSLSCLLMLTVPIDSLSKRKKKIQNFICPKTVPLWRVKGEDNERSYALSQLEQNLINQTKGFCSLVPSSHWSGNKGKNFPPNTILRNYLVRPRK